MIEHVTESLHGKVEGLGYFEKVFPLVEQKEIEGKTIVAQYISKGQYEHVSNFDNYNGVAYFRKYEDIEIGSKEMEFRSCSQFVTVKYPLRFVCCIRRDQLENDCAFSDDAFAYGIINELSGNTGALKQRLRATSVDVSAVRISTDRKKILESEFPNNDLVDINYEFSLIAIDFAVTIDISQKCMITPCENYG